VSNKAPVRFGDVLRDGAGLFDVAAVPIAFEGRTPIKHPTAMVGTSTGFYDSRTTMFAFDQDAEF
jgi:hypothetical protein